LTLKTILRRADKHFDQVVVQAVVELPLQSPLELRVVQVARMKIEVVSVHRHRRILELDDQFDAITLSSGGELQQGMLIKLILE
jgi:hypothetical protein